MKKELITKGYKVTDSEMKCRGFQFELGKRFKETGRLEICENGFHFCEVLNDCFNYYTFDASNRVFEVVSYGKLDTQGDKHACLEIEFIKEISWLEVLTMVNLGKGNSGRSNAGNYNAGYSNAGNRNAGNRNAGNRNAGNYNAGNRNAGYSNAGYSNAGNGNAGNDNAGYSNAGNDNAGNDNAGNGNAGNGNAGNRNAGNYNAGNRNAGYSNAGNDNAGAFNNLQANYMLFNKPSNWTYEYFINSKAYALLSNIETTRWVPSYAMTEHEKTDYPYYVTTLGYVKNLPYKEAFTNAWNNWSESSKQAFTSLPNFDAEIFLDITGVDISK